jgi:hypothetical protein
MRQNKKAIIYVLYSYKPFGRTVNKKCLASETVLFECQLNCYEVRNVDGGGGDDDDDVDMVDTDIYLLTAIGLTPGGSSTVHIYAQKYIEQHS